MKGHRVHRAIVLCASCFVWLCMLAHAADPLQDIERTYQKTNTLQTEFVQSTFIKLLEKTVHRPGRIFYQKGGKLRIEYAGDKMTHYITDGKTLWIKDPKTKETQTYYLKDSGLPEEALKFLTELGALRKYFKVSMVKPYREEIVYNLEPKQKTTYRHLFCIFDEQHYLKELTIYSHSGNKSEYQFFNRQVGKPLSAKLFLP